MRFWKVDSIRAYLQSIRDDWKRDEAFSRGNVDVWLRKEPDGSYRHALLQFYPSTKDTPAITPEAAIITFCRQLGSVEVRLFLEELEGRGGLFHGEIDL